MLNIAISFCDFINFIYFFSLILNRFIKGNLIKYTEMENLKKSLEAKINMLEGQLRNADHENQTLIEEKVNMSLYEKSLHKKQSNKIFC